MLPAKMLVDYSSSDEEGGSMRLDESQPVGLEAVEDRPDIVNECLALGFSATEIHRALEENPECKSANEVLEMIFKLRSEECTTLERVFEGRISLQQIEAARQACGSDASDSMVADYIASNILPKEEDAPDDKHGRLRMMGFSNEEINNALQRCGEDAGIEVLANFLGDTGEMVKMSPQSCRVPSLGKLMEEWDKDTEFIPPGRRTRERGRQRIPLNRGMSPDFDEDNFETSDLALLARRTIPEPSKPPPFFFFENVANMPSGTWDDISRFFDGIEPELVNSKIFCPASRPRKYVHNLPIAGRFKLNRNRPQTLQELVPEIALWQPPWDTRTHLRCITSNDERAAHIQNRARELALQGENYDQEEAKEVLKLMKLRNLVWRGRGILSPLKIQEVELIQGFDVDHTLCGQTLTERVRSLGCAMQVDTVAWQLSVLKPLFPSGIRALSLFAGIGGVEVALDELGIPINFLVSVELNQDCHKVLRKWWEKKPRPGCKHKILSGIQELTTSKLTALVKEAGGGFDLVAGGSPCNNLSGKNRFNRTGISGDKSIFFFDFPRILEKLRAIMKS